MAQLSASAEGLAGHHVTRSPSYGAELVPELFQKLQLQRDIIYESASRVSRSGAAYNSQRPHPPGANNQRKPTAAGVHITEWNH